MIKKPDTREHFPEKETCPVCGTNEDAECLLVAIDGASDGEFCEAAPVHLWCSVGALYNEERGYLFRSATKRRAGK